MDRRQLLKAVLAGDPDAISKAQLMSGANPLYCLSDLEIKVFCFLGYGYFPDLQYLDHAKTWLWPGAVIDWYVRKFEDPENVRFGEKLTNWKKWRKKFRQAFIEAVDQGEADRGELDNILNNFMENGQKAVISGTY